MNKFEHGKIVLILKMIIFVYKRLFNYVYLQILNQFRINYKFNIDLLSFAFVRYFEFKCNSSNYVQFHNKIYVRYVMPRNCLHI